MVDVNASLEEYRGMREALEAPLLPLARPQTAGASTSTYRSTGWSSSRAYAAIEGDGSTRLGQLLREVATCLPWIQGNAVDSLGMLHKAKTWLVKVMPFLARWGSNTTPNPQGPRLGERRTGSRTSLLRSQLRAGVHSAARFVPPSDARIRPRYRLAA